MRDANKCATKGYQHISRLLQTNPEWEHLGWWMDFIQFPTTLRGMECHRIWAWNLPQKTLSTVCGGLVALRAGGNTLVGVNFPCFFVVFRGFLHPQKSYPQLGLGRAHGFDVGQNPDTPQKGWGGGNLGLVASLIRRIYQILLTTLSSQSYKAVKVLHWRWRSSGLSVCGRATQSVVKHVFTYVIVGAHNTIVSCSDRWTQKIWFVFPLGRAMWANRRNRNTM